MNLKESERAVKKEGISPGKNRCLRHLVLENICPRSNGKQALIFARFTEPRQVADATHDG